MDEVIASAGFKGRMGAKAKGIGYVKEGSPTIVAGIESHVVIAIDQQDGKGIGGQSHGILILKNEPVTYRGDSITSPLNYSNSKGGVCHTLSNDSRNYVVIPVIILNDQGGQ